MPINFDKLTEDQSSKPKHDKAFKHSANTEATAQKTLGAGALVQRQNGSAPIVAANFDAASHMQMRAQLDEDTQKRAAALNGAVTAYAQSRMAQILSDIDLAAASIRANAMDAMGMGQPPEGK